MKSQKQILKGESIMIIKGLQRKIIGCIVVGGLILSAGTSVWAGEHCTG